MKKCIACALHQTRKNQVIGRGIRYYSFKYSSMIAKGFDPVMDTAILNTPECVPILFIGEGPGKNEDALGKPFIGDSGELLDSLIAKAVMMAEVPYAPSYYITNVVQCRPTDTIQGPNRPPTKEEVKLCQKNLLKVYNKVDPKRVVLLGKVAETAYRKLMPDCLCLRHPAYILRKGGVESTEFRTFARDLSVVFKELNE